MSKNTEGHEEKAGEAAEVTTELAIVAGSALLAGVGGAGVAAASALAFLPYVAGKVVPAFMSRKQRAAENWWEQVVGAGSDDDVARLLRERGDDPDVEDVVAEALRKVLESSRAGIPALAMLTREYLREGKGADRFFRSFAAVVGELSPAEYADMRTMLQWLAASARGSSVTVSVSCGPDAPDEPTFLDLPRPKGEEWQWHRAGFAVPSGLAIALVLKRHGLASEAPAGALGQVSGPDCFHVDVATIARTLRLLV